MKYLTVTYLIIYLFSGAFKSDFRHISYLNEVSIFTNSLFQIVISNIRVNIFFEVISCSELLQTVPILEILPKLAKLHIFVVHAETSNN